MNEPRRCDLPSGTASVFVRRRRVGKSREILIATRGHFASEIEGGHLDPSRRDDGLSLSLPPSVFVSERDDFASLALSGHLFFPTVGFPARGERNARNSKTPARLYRRRKSYLETSFLPQSRDALVCSHVWRRRLFLLFFHLDVEPRKTCCRVSSVPPVHRPFDRPRAGESDIFPRPGSYPSPRFRASFLQIVTTRQTRAH